MVACLFHTAKITIRALRTLVLFCSNFNLCSSFAIFLLQILMCFHDFLLEIPLAHCVRGGMVRIAGQGKGEKDGRREKRTVAGKHTAAAHLFPLFDPKRDAPFRRRR